MDNVSREERLAIIEQEYIEARLQGIEFSFEPFNLSKREVQRIKAGFERDQLIRHLINFERDMKRVKSGQNTGDREMNEMKTEKKGLLEQAREAQPEIASQFDIALRELGVKGKPIPARQLQAMTREAGMRPEDNELSRDIIRMRDE